ncbi:MAG TPA: hypothetical protein VJI67_03295 [archaeon]|nr:hypothetical protein [archaeon]HLD81056.1 hypothetical protein [archaeon]
MALDPLEVYKWVFSSFAAVVYLWMVFRLLMTQLKKGEEVSGESGELLGSFKVLAALYLVFYMEIKYIELFGRDPVLVNLIYFGVQLFLFLVLLRKLVTFFIKLRAIRRLGVHAPV